MKYTARIAGALLCGLLFAGCDQHQPVAESATKAEEPTCDTSKMTVGACLMDAGVQMGSADWNALSKLMMSGNFRMKSHLTNGVCVADITVSGNYGGSSYNRNFSCSLR